MTSTPRVLISITLHLAAISFAGVSFAQDPPGNETGANADALVEAKADAKAAAAIATRSEVQLAEAKIQLDKNQKDLEAKSAELQAVEQENETLAQLISGTFLEKAGVTAGIAMAVQIPTHYLRAPKVTAIPYIAAFPMYWGAPKEVRKYCASTYAGGDMLAAQKAADALSTEDGKEKLKKLVRQFRTSPKVTAEQAIRVIDEVDVDDDYDLETWSHYVDIAEQIQVAVYPDGAQTPVALTEDQEAAFADALGSVTWLHGTAARCWPKRIGFFIGLPLEYNAATQFGADASEVERTAQPGFAAGAVYAPNAWFHILAGFTYGEVKVKSTVGTETVTSTKGLLTPTVGIGGALDIINLLK